MLVLAVESFMQTSQVYGVALGMKIMTMKINKCCGIESTSKKPYHMMYNHVMKVMTVSLSALITTPVKERRIRWTTYANLLKWFQRFWVFLIKYEFAQEGSNGELVIDHMAKQ